MALHSYTFLALQQACQHATGKATPDTGSTYAGVVNDALYHLATVRAWHWRTTALSLDLVASQSYVNLPTDFGELYALAGTANTTLPTVHWTSLDRIAALRQQQGIAGSDLFVALSYAAQASSTAAPTARLEVFPTPAANATAAITGFYLRVPPAMSGNTDVPDVPAVYLPALKALCRAFAVSDEDQQVGPDWDRANAMIAQLAGRDTMAQPHGHRVVGTVDFVDGAGGGPAMSDLRFFPAASAGVT